MYIHACLSAKSEAQTTPHQPLGKLLLWVLDLIWMQRTFVFVLNLASRNQIHMTKPEIKAKAANQRFALSVYTGT